MYTVFINTFSMMDCILPTKTFTRVLRLGGVFVAFLKINQTKHDFFLEKKVSLLDQNGILIFSGASSL